MANILYNSKLSFFFFHFFFLPEFKWFHVDYLQKIPQNLCRILCHKTVTYAVVLLQKTNMYWWGHLYGLRDVKRYDTLFVNSAVSMNVGFTGMKTDFHNFSLEDIPQKKRKNLHLWFPYGVKSAELECLIIDDCGQRTCLKLFITNYRAVLFVWLVVAEQQPTLKVTGLSS